MPPPLRHRTTPHRLFTVFGIVLFLYCPFVNAKTLTVQTTADWNQWQRPGDAITIDASGISPALVRQNINAVADAADFGGGIRVVGSDTRNATNLVDGDPETTWNPAATDPIENWFIEVDLGRAVSARSLRLTLHPDAPPLEFFTILLSNGERFFNISGVTLPNTVRYQDRHNYSFNQERVFEIDLALNPLRFIRIEADRPTPGARLAEIEVLSIGDNLALGLRQRGGAIDILNEIGGQKEGFESPGNSGAIIDGDIVSNWTYKGPSERDAEFTIDLGSVFWVDRMRILGDLAGIPPTAFEVARTRVGAINFPWYKLWASDGSLAPDGSLRWDLVGELPENPRNWRDIVHFEERFDVQPLRYFRLRFGTRTCCLSGTTAEIQVFGQGFPARTRILSPIYDLGSVQNFRTVEWAGQTPAGSRLEIRSRSGNLLDEEYVYYDKDGKEVTQRRWDRFIPSFRGPIDTLRATGSDWSSWSRIYPTGQSDFLSPSPRHYAQFEASFVGETPFAAATIQRLSLEYGPPLATVTRSQVLPEEATPGATNIFTYVLDIEVERGDLGFSRLALRSPSPMRFVGLRLDGQPQEVELLPSDQELLLALAVAVRRNARLEIDFESRVFFDQTPFDGFLLDTSGTVRQRIDPGVAERVGGAHTVGLPIGSSIFANIDFSHRAFSPNGDGINDQLHIEVDLVNLLTPQPLWLRVYDLRGALIHHQQQAGTLGRRDFDWDGRDQAGRQAPPGLYIIELGLDGDARQPRWRRSIAVAY
jgi:hypothetical protein